MTKPMISDALRLMRLYWGYSQAELAELLRVGQSLISEVESGKRSVSLELLERYSVHFKIRMSDLMIFAEQIGEEPVPRRGRLVVAGKLIQFLERMKPDEPRKAEAKASLG